MEEEVVEGSVEIGICVAGGRDSVPARNETRTEPRLPEHDSCLR